MTPISKVEQHMLNGFCATLWCSVNRFLDLTVKTRVQEPKKAKKVLTKMVLTGKLSYSGFYF